MTHSLPALEKNPETTVFSSLHFSPRAVQLWPHSAIAPFLSV